MLEFLHHNLYLFSGLFQILLSLIMGMRVAAYGAHRKGNREFVQFMLLLALTAACYCAAVSQTRPDWYFLFWRFGVAPGIFFLPALYLHFVSRFTNWDPWERHRIRVPVFLLPVSFSLLSFFSPGFFYNRVIENTYGLLIQPRPWVMVYLAYSVLITLWVLVLIFRRFRGARMSRKSMMIFMTGTAVCVLLGSFFDEILTQFTTDHPGMGFLGINLYTVFLYFSVTDNQKIFDVEHALIDFERLKYFDSTSAALNAEVPHEELLQMLVDNARKASGARSVFYVDVALPDRARLAQFSTDEKSVLRQVVEHARKHSYRLFNWHSLKDFNIPFVADILKTGEMQRVKSINALLGEIIPFASASLFQMISGVKWYTAFPVKVGDRIRGILVFSLTQEVKDYAIYHLFTNQCAQILRNHDLLNSYRTARDEQAILLDNIPTQIWYLRDENTFGRINNAFAAFHGMTPGEIEGRPVWEILKKRPALDPLISRCAQIFETRQKSEFEEWMVNLPGEKRLFLVTLTPRLNASGAVDYVVCVGSDITEFRKIETQLYQSQKMEAIGQLAGGVAHNFNNLLLSIMGYAELISGESADPRIAQFAGRIVMASQHGSGLSQQLLAFARKGKYEISSVNLSGTVDEVILLIQNTFDKRIQIRSEIASPGAVTAGDPTQLMQMLLNLSLNARDAMPDGGVLKFVVDERVLDDAFCRKHDFAKPGRFAHVAVKDTGSGIPKEVLPHIFEPFFTTKETGKGFGLGLASVYGCVKNHNGYITVESIPEKGTQFDIYLPPAPLPAPEEKKDPLPEQRKVSGGRVMIVEDEEDVRTVTALALRKAGFEVQSFGSGPSALAYYKDHTGDVDLVLLDITMPEMNGLECMQALMAINPGVKIVIASGHTFEGEPHLLVEKGAKGFIQKPWKRAELVKILDETIGKS